MLRQLIDFVCVYGHFHHLNFLHLTLRFLSQFYIGPLLNLVNYSLELKNDMVDVNLELCGYEIVDKS